MYKGFNIFFYKCWCSYFFCWFIYNSKKYKYFKYLLVVDQIMIIWDIYIIVCYLVLEKNNSINYLGK